MIPTWDLRQDTVGAVCGKESEKKRPTDLYGQHQNKPCHCLLVTRVVQSPNPLIFVILTWHWSLPQHPQNHLASTMLSKKLLKLLIILHFHKQRNLQPSWLSKYGWSKETSQDRGLKKTSNSQWLSTAYIEEYHSVTMCILPFRTHTWCHINNNLICFTVSTFPFPCPQRSHPGDVCCPATSSWITPPLPTPGNFARWSNTAESLRRAAASGRLERTKCSARFSTSREILTSFAHACVNWWTWIYIGLVKFETTIREMHGDKNHEVWHKIDENF